VDESGEDGDGGGDAEAAGGVAPAALVAHLAPRRRWRRRHAREPATGELHGAYIYRALAHQWDKDGNHMGWYEGMGWRSVSTISWGT
jgi:hypothetical protein